MEDGFESINEGEDDEEEAEDGAEDAHGVGIVGEVNANLYRAVAVYRTALLFRRRLCR